MNVREFLTNLNLAQEQCRLSEQEFLARMLATSTAGAHKLIQMWTDNGNNVAQIYESLLIHYDKRPSAEEAKASLFSYKVAKNEDLAKAEAKIMIWVGTAANAIPAGPSRIQYTNFFLYNVFRATGYKTTSLPAALNQARRIDTLVAILLIYGI
jgi:hypothetical protein